MNQFQKKIVSPICSEKEEFFVPFGNVPKNVFVTNFFRTIRGNLNAISPIKF